MMIENLTDRDRDFLSYRYEELVKHIEGITIYGPNPRDEPRAALAAFNVEGLHATDVSMILDQYVVSNLLSLRDKRTAEEKKVAESGMEAVPMDGMDEKVG